MYERLANKNETPDMEQLLSHIGKAKELFAIINTYLMDELATTEKKIYFDVHDKGWAIGYRTKKDYVCNIVMEKDAFIFVTRLSEDNIKKAYDCVSTHAKECIDNSPYRHRGWLEYRALEMENLKDVKRLLQLRVSGKQKSIG